MMTFAKIVLEEAEQQYKQLANGTLQCPIKFPAIPSLEKYIKNSANFNERIQSENDGLSKAYKTIKNNKKGRLAAEKAKEKTKQDKIARQEEERLLEEKARQDEIARQEKEQQEQEARKMKLILRIVFFPFFLVYCVFYGLFLMLKLLFSGESGRTRFQYVSFASPILISIVFAIILFSNTDKINIVSSFSKWFTIWSIFSLVSLIVSISLLKKRLKVWKSSDATSVAGSIAASAVMAFCLILAIVFAVKLAFDPTEFVNFSVTGKTESTSFQTYYSTISFDLKNNSNAKITYISGEMKFYNGTDEVGSWNVNFNGEYDAGKSYAVAVKFDEKSKTGLYTTTFENLGVTYRITSMKFNGDYKEQKFNGDTVTLKSVGYTSDSENAYNKAVSLFERGRYTEALAIFKTLGEYKDSALYATQCENMDFNQQMEVYMHDVAGKNAILPDHYSVFSFSQNQSRYYDGKFYDAFFASLIVPPSKADVYQTAFVEKLNNYGFIQVDYNTFQKGETMIYFDDVECGYSDSSDYYMIFYTWKIN